MLQRLFISWRIKVRQEAGLPKHLSGESPRLVRMTARAFKAFGTEIAEAIRARLMAAPESRLLFADSGINAPDWGKQFGERMFVIADHIGEPALISDLLDEMARRHRAEGWTFEHYELFLAAMLVSLRDVLGEGATDRVLDAWEETFRHLHKMIAARRPDGPSDAAKAA